MPAGVRRVATGPGASSRRHASGEHGSSDGSGPGRPGARPPIRIRYVRPSRDRTSSSMRRIASRFSGREKSVGGSLRNGGSSPGSRLGSTWDRRTGMAPTSSGFRKSSSTADRSEKLALRNDSFDVFSSSRRTRSTPSPAVEPRMACRPGPAALGGPSATLNRFAHPVEHLDLEARRRHRAQARAIAWTRLRTLWLPNAGRSRSQCSKRNRAPLVAEHQIRHLSSGGPVPASRPVGPASLRNPSTPPLTSRTVTSVTPPGRPTRRGSPDPSPGVPLEVVYDYEAVEDLPQLADR